MRNRPLTMTILIGLCLLLAGPTAASGQERVTYFHNDALGSPVAATDADGDILWTESYRPYGDRIERSESTDEHAAFYTGKPHDDTTGLTYLGARDYDPVLGRFLGMDPVGFDEASVQSFNKYAYANNNPYRFSDPNGESPLDLIDFALDVGDLLVQEIVYVAAKINGDEAVADLAAQAIRDKRGDAVISTLGVINPVPGTSRAFKVTRAVHGNSKKSTKAQHGYVIIDTHRGGKVAKVGVSGQPMKGRQSPRAEEQVRKWNNETNNQGRYKAIVVKKIPAGQGARERILDWEKREAKRRIKELDPARHKRPWPKQR